MIVIFYCVLDFFNHVTYVFNEPWNCINLHSWFLNHAVFAVFGGQLICTMASLSYCTAWKLRSLSHSRLLSQHLMLEIFCIGSLPHILICGILSFTYLPGSITVLPLEALCYTVPLKQLEQWVGIDCKWYVGNKTILGSYLKATW